MLQKRVVTVLTSERSLADRFRSDERITLAAPPVGTDSEVVQAALKRWQHYLAVARARLTARARALAASRSVSSREASTYLSQVGGNYVFYLEGRVLQDAKTQLTTPRCQMVCGAA